MPLASPRTPSRPRTSRLNATTRLRCVTRSASTKGVEQQKQNLKIKEFSAVNQIRLGPPPASVNQYANKTTYATCSRWCQATAALSNGKTDTIYWRMDYLVEGKGFSINFDHCATNHDLMDSNCQKLRAGK